MPKTYLTAPTKRANGARGDGAFQKHLLDAMAQLDDIITAIENTGGDSTMTMLQAYGEAVPVENVRAMLENIRTDLLKAKRELEKAAQAH